MTALAPPAQGLEDVGLDGECLLCVYDGLLGPRSLRSHPVWAASVAHGAKGDLLFFIIVF